VEKWQLELRRRGIAQKGINYNVEKYFGVGQATDDNIAQAHCMLDTYGNKYIHNL